MRNFLFFIIVVCLTCCSSTSYHNAQTSHRYHSITTESKDREIQNISNAIQKLTPTIERQWCTKLSTQISAVSHYYNIDWRILVVVTKQESNFDSKARNRHGIGLGQIEPLWAKFYGYKHQDLWNWKFNVETMGRILAYYKAKQNVTTSPYWATAYHSLTPKYRQRYWRKIQKHYEVIVKNESNTILPWNVAGINNTSTMYFSN